MQKRAQTDTIGRHGGGLRLIAAFKLLKGLALLALGVGAVKLLHKDIATEVERWIDLFRIDPNGTYAQHLIDKLAILNDRRLKQFSVGTFVYAGLLLTEGVGLSLKKRWAEYFTLITTSLLIPLEIYELAKRVSGPKVFVLVLNIAIVIYLAISVRRKLENPAELDAEPEGEAEPSMRRP